MIDPINFLVSLSEIDIWRRETAVSHRGRDKSQ